MKHLYTYGLSLIVASSIATATSISTTAPGYNLASNISLNVEGPLSGDQDWVGIYKKGSTNDWNNVLGWSWVEHPTEGLSIDTIIDNGGYSGRDILLDGGEFEARLFFHNSYHAESSTPFYMTRADMPNFLTVNPMYQVGDTPQVAVNTVLSGDQDWVGIYPINSDNSWSNVIAWNWVESNGIVDINKAISGKELLAGEYEARLFFHNSYTVEASNNFFVSNQNSAISTTKDTYAVNELVAINIDTALSGDQDWVGIFPKNSDNSWGNVLGWNWVGNGSNILDKNDASLPAGEYEIRLFFHNEYGANAVARASYGFTVVGEAPANVYGEEGPYMNEVKEIHNNNDKYVAYYPEHHVQNAPIVLMLGYFFAEGTYINGTKTTLRHEGIMKYLASLGCYVIGNKSTHDEWQDGNKWPKLPYDKAIIEAINKGADKTRFALIGHSAGGMATYRMMKKYKSEGKGYGETKNFIIDLHGYHAAGMTRADLQSLNDTDTLMLMYGGLNGNANESEHTNNPDFSEDPRVLLTLSHLLPGANKGFIVLDTKDHMYSYGEWEAINMNGNQYASIKDKNKLLKPIDAMVKYEFFNNNGQHNDARAILFDGYEQTKQDVLNATNQFRDGKEKDDVGYPYRFGCSTWSGIDYCSDHGL